MSLEAPWKGVTSYANSRVQLKSCGQFKYGTSALALAIDAHTVAVHDAVVVLSFRRLPRVHLTDLRKRRMRGGRRRRRKRKKAWVSENRRDK